MMRVTKEMRTLSRRPFWKRTLAFRNEEEAGPKAYGTAPGPWSALSLFHYKVTALGAAGASHFGKWTTFIPIHIQMLFRDGTVHQLLKQSGDIVTRDGDRRISEATRTQVSSVNRTETVISREGDVRHTHHSPFIMQRQDTARHWLVQLLRQHAFTHDRGSAAQADSVTESLTQIRPFLERIRERDAFTLSFLEQAVDRPFFVEQFIRETGLYPKGSPDMLPAMAVLRSRDPLKMTHYTVKADRDQIDRPALSQVRYQETLSRLLEKRNTDIRIEANDYLGEKAVVSSLRTLISPLFERLAGSDSLTRQVQKQLVAHASSAWARTQTASPQPLRERTLSRETAGRYERDTLHRLFYKTFDRAAYFKTDRRTHDRQTVLRLTRLLRQEDAKRQSDRSVDQGGRMVWPPLRMDRESRGRPVTKTSPEQVAREMERVEIRLPSGTGIGLKPGAASMSKEEQLYRMQLLSRLEQDDQLFLIPLRERLLQQLTKVRHTAWTPRVLQYARTVEKSADQEAGPPTAARPEHVRRESGGRIRLFHRQETAVSVMDRLSAELVRIGRSRQLVERIVTKEGGGAEWMKDMREIRRFADRETISRRTVSKMPGRGDQLQEGARPDQGIFLLQRQEVNRDVEQRLVRHERMTERLFERDVHAAFLSQDETRSRELFIRSLERIQERFARLAPPVFASGETATGTIRPSAVPGVSLKHRFVPEVADDPVLPAWKARIDTVYRLLKAGQDRPVQPERGRETAKTRSPGDQAPVKRLSAKEISLNRLRPHPLVMNAFYTNRMQLAKWVLTMQQKPDSMERPPAPAKRPDAGMPAWKDRFTALTRWQRLRASEAGRPSRDGYRIGTAHESSTTLSLTHLHEAADSQVIAEERERVQKLLRVWVRQAVMKERLKPVDVRTAPLPGETGIHMWISDIRRTFSGTFRTETVPGKKEPRRGEAVHTVTREFLRQAVERLKKVTQQADPGVVLTTRHSRTIFAPGRESGGRREGAVKSVGMPGKSGRTMMHVTRTASASSEDIRTSVQTYLQSVREKLTEQIRERETASSATVTERTVRERARKTGVQRFTHHEVMKTMRDQFHTLRLEKQRESVANVRTGPSQPVTLTPLMRSEKSAQWFDTLSERYDRLRQVIERVGPSTVRERNTVSVRSRSETERRWSSFVHKETQTGAEQETVRSEKQREVANIRKEIRDLKETVKESRISSGRGPVVRAPGTGTLRLPMFHRHTMTTVREQLQVLMQAGVMRPAETAARARTSGTGGYARDVASRADIRFLKQPGRESEANREARLRQVLSPRMDFRKQAVPEAPEPKKQKTTDEQVQIQTQVFESDYLKTQRERVQMETIVEKVFQEIERRNHFQRQRSGW